MEVQNRFSTGFLMFWSILFYWVIGFVFEWIFEFTGNEKMIGWIHVYLLIIVWIWFVAGVMVD